LFVEDATLEGASHLGDNLLAMPESLPPLGSPTEHFLGFPVGQIIHSTRSEVDAV